MRVCSVDGCQRKVRACGWCYIHLAEFRPDGVDRSCRVCASPLRPSVDMALLSASAAVVAHQTGFTGNQMAHHRRKCLSLPLVVVRCTVCAHPDLPEIEEMLRRQSLAKVSMATGMGRTTLHGHQRNHMDSAEYARRLAEQELGRLAAVIRFVGSGT